MIMFRQLLPALVLLIATPTVAQEPILRTELGSDAAIPGQPVELRITVLSPTWFPKPPELPSYDMPNLMVRLPPKSTFPVSEQINGETWSGIYRTYRLYPMIPGIFDIPPQTVKVYHAQPGSPDPITTELQTDTIRLSGVVPENALRLDPFIAARDLSLEQTIEGELTDIDAGEAVIRTLNVAVDGASPMVVPPLLKPRTVSGLTAYAQEPVASDDIRDGILYGSRKEQVTYVAGGGGRYVLPQIELEWYNLETGQIETEQVEGLEITVNGPPSPSAPEGLSSKTITWGFVFLGAALLALAAGRIVGPWMSAWQAGRRRRYRMSADYAFRQALWSIRSRRLSAALHATTVWWQKSAGVHLALPAKLSDAFLPVGEALYGGKPSAPDRLNKCWSDASDALKDLARKTRKNRRRGEADLPPLNPQTPDQRRRGNLH